MESGAQSRAPNSRNRRRVCMDPPSVFMFFFGNPDLFNFVEQRLVADLQLARGPFAVPMSAIKRLQNQFAFGLHRCGTRRDFQRSSLVGQLGTLLWRCRPFKVLHGNLCIAKNDHFASEIFKLADVAWPRERRQSADDVLGQVRSAFLQRVGVLSQEIIEKRRYILDSVTKRRETQTRAIEAEIQLSAEASGIDLRLQIDRSGRDETND